MTSTAKALVDSALPELPATALRRLFRASALALLQNKPLREMSSHAVDVAHALSKTEVDALGVVGLSTQPWRNGPERDPLALSIIDYMALIETSLTTKQAAAMLGVDVSRIRQRLRERSLFGVEHDGEWRLPRFQFERKNTLPGLSQALQALPAELNPLDVAEWFLTPNPDLEAEGSGAPESPRAWLLRGRSPQRIAQLAWHL